MKERKSIIILIQNLIIKKTGQNYWKEKEIIIVIDLNWLII